MAEVSAAVLAAAAFPAHTAPLAGGVALTPGSIAFANASGALAADSTLTLDAAHAFHAERIIQSSAPLLRAPARVLARLHAAFAAVASAPVNIGVFGDSIAEGYNLPDVTTRWVEQLQVALRARYQSPLVPGGIGYQPAKSYTGYQRIVVGGTPNDQPFTGLGVRAQRLSSAGETLTLAVTATGFDVFYTKGPSNVLPVGDWAGTFSIAVDGATTGTWTVNGVAANGTTNIIDSTGASLAPGAVAQVRGLGGGAHTIVLTGLTNHVAVEGIMVYLGDEAAGIRVWDMSHSGMSLNQMNAFVFWQGAFATVKPQIVLLEQGVNDSAASSTTIAAFKANLVTMIASLRAPYASTALPSIVLVASHKTVTTDASQSWSAFVNAMYDVAAADGNVAVLDFNERTGGDAIATNGLGTALLQDGTHPNAGAGSAFWAQAVAEALTIPGAQLPWQGAVVTPGSPSLAGTNAPLAIITKGSVGRAQYYATSDGLRPATLSFVDVDPANISNAGIAMNTRLEAVPLASITVTLGGSGYPASIANGAVTLTGGDPITPATAHYVTNGSGVITSVVLDTAGLYRSAPPFTGITFGGGGTGAQAYASMAGIARTPIDVRHYNIPDTGEDNSGSLFVSTGGNGSFTTYQAQNLRPFGTRAWRGTLQGGLEVATDSGSQAVIVMPGGMLRVAQEMATITADISAVGTPATISLNAPANLTGAWPVPGAYEYTPPGGLTPVNFPATLYMRVSDPTTGLTETFGYSAVTNSGVANGPLTFTIVSRGLGAPANRAFTVAHGCYAEPEMRSVGIYTRIGNNVSDAFLAQPVNGVYDGVRWGFVIGSKLMGAGPSGVTFGVHLDGTFGSAIVPDTNVVYNIGSSTKRWLTIFAAAVNLSSTLGVYTAPTGLATITTGTWTTANNASPNTGFDLTAPGNSGTGGIVGIWQRGTSAMNKWEGIHDWTTANRQTTVGAAGAGSALPATPTGYLKITVNGTAMVVPYYAAV